MRLLRNTIVLLALLGACSGIGAGAAQASPSIRYGVQDDAWLLTGPGTLDSRLAILDGLGTDIVRVTIRWDQVAALRPADARDPDDPAYRWGPYDTALAGLRAHGIDVLATIWGAPRWTNGGRAPNWLPRSGSTIASFVTAAARRYPWIRRWTIWNEPNGPVFLRPVSAKLYTARLLNPAYRALKAVSRRNLVAGGVTGPRAGSGISPVTFMRGMRAAHARLDAYAQNPYPLRPGETPWSGGCERCAVYTMATLPKLIADVKRSFGAGTRIWLTEYGYNTKPPSLWLGVSRALQARYVAEAALRAYLAPRVDLLINFLVRDEPNALRWTSGFFTSTGSAKPSYRAFALPFAEVSRRGTRTAVWGQVRPGTGAQTYRVQRWTGHGWSTIGSTRRTSARGFFRRTVAAPKGARLRVQSPSANRTSLTLVVH